MGANRPEKACPLGLRTLQNQRFVWKVGLLTAKVFDLLLIAISQGIKAEAVPFGIHDCAQLGLKEFILGWLQLTLKDGVLNPLAVVDALPGDLPQALRPAASAVLTS